MLNYILIGYWYISSSNYTSITTARLPLQTGAGAFPLSLTLYRHLFSQKSNSRKGEKVLK